MTTYCTLGTVKDSDQERLFKLLEELASITEEGTSSTRMMDKEDSEEFEYNNLVLDTIRGLAGSIKTETE